MVTEKRVVKIFLEAKSCKSRRVGRSTKILDLTVGPHSMARVQRAPYRDRLGRKQIPCGWTHATKKSKEPFPPQLERASNAAEKRADLI